MGKLCCDVCGSDIAIQLDGKAGRCICCGAVYPMERLRAMVGTPEQKPVQENSQPEKDGQLEDLQGLVEQHYAAGRFQECLENVNKMLEINPGNAHACRKYEELQALESMTVKDGILIKYAGLAKEVQIPAYVTEIGDKAFCGCKSLTSVRVPENVKRIGDGAFYKCTFLTSVTIEQGVEEIGAWAFEECIALNSVTMLEGVRSIGREAFKGCSSLTGMTIPKSVTEIGWYAFSGCTSLASVTIPESVTAIGRNAFEGCVDLSSVTCPDGLFTSSRFGDTKAWRDICRKKLEKEEKAQKEAQRKAWRDDGLCQHCGGSFQGFFTKTCSKCGKAKDY